MNSRTYLIVAGAFGTGLLLGACLIGGREAGIGPSAAAADENVAARQSSDDADLHAEVERLKEKATDQAHVMMSVSYHFNNLWFAGQHGNWPLAQFYWNETRSHLRWAVRVIPVRKDNQGREINLKAILEAVENSPLKQLDEAIKAESRDQFVDAYKFTLEGCYACHTASDKPYLRLQIPSRPMDAMINFEPAPKPFAEEEPSQFKVPEKAIQAKE
jgi:hypothetical protein